jgi:hypothetical protein
LAESIAVAIPVAAQNSVDDCLGSGHLSADLLTPEPALSYLRYKVWLDENGLDGLGLTSLVPKLDSLREMSAGENRNDLAHIGARAAARQVRDDHFPSIFDLSWMLLGSCPYPCQRTSRHKSHDVVGCEYCPVYA